MTHNSPKIQLRKQLESLAGDPSPLSPEHHGPPPGDDLVDRSAAIMNNYTYFDGNTFGMLLAYCLLMPNPEQAVFQLEQFLRVAPADGEPLRLKRETTFMLAAVFTASNALSNRLNGHPNLVRELDCLPDPLATHAGTGYYVPGDTKAGTVSDGSPDPLRSLHHFQSVHLVRICARNSIPSVHIADINTELSLVAESIIDSCLGMAFDRLRSRLSSAPATHALTVLGLGKLGGRELNVSSDIDLIYLMGDPADDTGYHESLSFHIRLAEQLTRLLSEPTELGFFYRVDTRLRADGGSGPLVRSSRDYLRYLEMRGEPWERQMLLKARPVAGNREVGRRFLASIERFVFPSSISRSPNREIVEIKNMIEARITADGSKKTHLKLMPGGIRDIEFIAQCLQLLMGGKHPEVRVEGTLPALARLHDAKALSDGEYTTLRDAYILYRRVENTVQWRELLPAFKRPESAEELRSLAAFLGYVTDDGGNAGSRLKADLDAMLNEVRAVYNDIFSADENGDAEHELLMRAAFKPAGDEQVERYLGSLGFGDPESAGRAISRLYFGEVPPSFESAVHPAIERFVPALVTDIAGLPDASGTLRRFEKIVSAYNARQMLYGILLDNKALYRLLISIAQGSVFMTDQLAGDPSLLDWLIEEEEISRPVDVTVLREECLELAEKPLPAQEFAGACQSIKQREKLRTGVRKISGLSGTAEAFADLSRIAETIVRAVYHRAERDLRASPGGMDFAVLAGGRLGVNMMDFGSDIDCVFVYRPTGTADEYTIPEKASTFARHILHLLSGGGGIARVYEVDARLRPEGKNAVLATPLDEYRRYLDQRAAEWERLALIRIRPVAGDAPCAEEAMKLLHDFVFGRPFTGEELRRILDIRERMAAAGTSGGKMNIKTGRGGLADIDFVAQTYAAHFGSRNPEVRSGGTPAILAALRDAGCLDRHDVTTLSELYEFLCSVEMALRIGSGRPVNALPGDETETARVARLMGFSNTRRLRKRLTDSLSLAREVYDRSMSALLRDVSD